MGERDNIGLKLEQIFTSWYSWPDTINCTYICYATALWHCIEFSTFKDQLGTRAIKIWYAVFCSTKAMNSTVLYELNCFNGNFLLLILTQRKTKSYYLTSSHRTPAKTVYFVIYSLYWLHSEWGISHDTVSIIVIKLLSL